MPKFKRITYNSFSFIVRFECFKLKIFTGFDKRGGDAAFATGAFGRTLNRMGSNFAGRGDRYSARYRNSLFGK